MREPRVAKGPSVLLIIHRAHRIAELERVREFWASSGNDFHLADNQRMRLIELIEGEQLALFDNMVTELSK